MFMLFMGLQQIFAPPKPNNVAQREGAKPAVDNKVKDDDPDKPSVVEPNTKAEPANAKPDEKADAKSDPASGDKVADKPGDKPAEKKESSVQADTRVLDLPKEKLVTLGSMDPSHGYRLLPTFTTRGGAIERIELVDEKKEDRFRYRALEHRGGYLGYLGWRPTTDGVLINTIPDASPAMSARCPDVQGGLSVGDVLTAINGVEVLSYDGIQRVLHDIKSGTTVTLSILRKVDGAVRPLKFEATLSQPPLDILRTQEFLAEKVKGNLQRLSCLTTIASLGSQVIPLGTRSLKYFEGTLNDHWEMHPLDVPGGQGVEFRLPLADAMQRAGMDGNLVMVKRYRVFPVKNDASDKVAAESDAYTIDFETTIENKADKPIDVSVRHEALAGITLEGWWYSVKVSPHYFTAAGQRDVRYCDGDNAHNMITTRQIHNRELKTPLDEGLFLNPGGSLATRTLKYVGLDAQYFAAAFLPHPDAPESLQNLHQAGTDAVARVSDITSAQSQATNVAVWFETTPQTVAPGASMTTRYRVFAGPKDTKVLRHFGLERFIEYGSLPWITKPLSAILAFFYGIFRNYGIAIILLTLLVRSAMLPLGRKAALNGQKMQEMQPEMKRITETYKDDMQKRAKAMQDLYAKHNFKPLAGCLPLFIQIPIFMALYRCLSVDISLRQEPLIPGLAWCSNLASPDMMYDWSMWMPDFLGGRGTGYLGPYFNLLPFITIALFLVQQKVLMPKATDEQMQMTQNMMLIMTVFMGVLFFRVPAGLCIYFITSSLWSLAERKLVKRLLPPQSPESLAAAQAASANSAAAESNNKKKRDKEPPRPGSVASRWAELREMLDKPAVRSTTQRREERKPDQKNDSKDNRKRDDRKKRRDQ